MIEINLLPGKKRAAPGTGFKLALPDFRGLIASIKNPWLLVASAATALVSACSRPGLRPSRSRSGGSTR